jgi:hypothetical protein
VLISTAKLQSQLDTSDGVQLRTYYESLRSALSDEQSTWLPHWYDLSRFMAPQNQRFEPDDVDTGYRRDQAIIDNTATLALRTLSGGIMSTICSPSQTWFKLLPVHFDIQDDKEAQEWLADVEDKTRTLLIKSNAYLALHTAFEDMATYGTTAFAVLEDERDVIRCHPFPIGSYYLSGDTARRVDFCMRVVNMKVRELVDRFGFAAVDSATQVQYESNSGGLKEEWKQVVHVVHRNKYFGDGPQIGTDKMPWASNYYQLDSYKTTGPKSEIGLLSRGGFEEFPIIACRWRVTGENVYGWSPAMDALGDTMQLQLLTKRIMQAHDKMVNPPMVASPSLAKDNVSILPGGITYADTRDGAHGFKPAFQVQYNLEHAQQNIRETQKRINSALYVDMFLMFAQSDRREQTAEEVRAKREEKMLVMGPVTERANDEMLGPFLWRVMAIAERRGIYLPRPQSLVNKGAIRIEFVSVNAQAQRLQGIANMDRMNAMIGSVAGIDPSVLDIVDYDEFTKKYAELLGVPPEVVRDANELAAIRKQRADQQAQAQQADNAQKLAASAANLSKADVSSGNALGLLRGNLGV